MPSFALRLLGPPVVERDGEARRLGVKALAVLAYLALEGRSNRRALARMLWPEASDPLNSLSAARTAIVRTLGDEALHADTDTLALTPNWQVDALAFQALGPQDAWALWRGPLLEDFRLSEWDQGLGEEIEAWLYARRDALSETRRAHALTLAAQALQAGDLSPALPYLEVAAGTEGDPREDAARLLLLAHGALDHTDRATSTYATLTDRLRGELGVDPTPATQEAFALVRAGHPRACLNALQRELMGREPEAPTSEEERVPLVGRDHELRWLRERLAPVTEGRARAAGVLVLGEPGEGKTRLAREYAARLARQRVPHALLFGQATEGSAPLQAFERPLRDALRAHPERLNALNPVWRAALAELVPELTAAEAAHVPPDLAPRARQDAIRAVLLSAQHPTLLILDDLQWADHATVDLALHLLREPPEGGLALLVTARSTEDPHGSVRRLTETLAREHLGAPLPLSPLDETAVEALAYELGRDDLNARDLHRMSGGNPFFLLELLRAEPGAPPERVGTFLSARLAALPDLERQVLGALAVLGDGQGLGVLRRTSGRSEAELDAALETLRAGAWLRLEDDGAHYAHDLTRQVMLHELSASRRALLHLRAARALRERPVQAAPHHWAARGAWDEDDLTPAHTALLAAGANYALRGDLQGGLTWFDRAQEALPDPARRGHTLVERARVLSRYGRLEEALSALDAADLLLSGGEPVPRATALVMRAQLLAMKLGRLDEAQALTDQVLRLIDGRQGITVSLVRSDALNVQGWVHQQKKDWPAARSALEAGLAIRQTLQDVQRMAASLSNLGPVLWRLKDPLAQDTFQRCIDLCASTGDVLGSARARHNLAHMWLESGEVSRALPLFQTAYEEQASVGDHFSMALTLVNVGAAEFSEQRYVNADQYYRQALFDIARSNAGTFNAVFLDALVNSAEASLCLGRPQDAVGALNQIEGHLGRTLDQWEHAVFHCLLKADLAAVQGEGAEVRRQLQEALRISGHDGAGWQRAEVEARLEGTGPWSAWADALTSRNAGRLIHALELDLETWRQAYLLDALAALGHPDMHRRADAIRARFAGPSDVFLQHLQSSSSLGRQS